MRRAFLLLAVCLASLALLFGCGGGGAGSGGLRLWMADAPLPNVTSLVVTIDRIEAHHNGQWVAINAESQSIDLLDLTRDAMVVANGGLPPGDFNQVRLFISSATVTDDTGTYDVTVPSAAQTGLKLNINSSVAEGSVTQVLLDFNVEKSLIRQGNGDYRLQPVIPAVLMNLAGTVSGTVTLNDLPVHGALVTAVYTAGTAYPLGTEVNTSTTAADGTFKVWALMEGTYTINVTFTDATDADFVGSVTDVVVVAENDTNVGTIALTPAP